MRYVATYNDAGPVVAMEHGALGAVIVCEFLTMAAANREADRLNREARAMAAIAVRNITASTTPRRSVRFFQNEDVHG